MRSIPPRSSLPAAARLPPGRGGWIGPVGGDHPDPFAINPIRRSAVLVAVSAAAFFGPLAVGGPAATTAMLAGGWMGMMGLAIGVPVLVLSLGEETYRRLHRQLRPAVDQLDLPPRLVHVLQRHGYTTIATVEHASDAALLLLSNMDPRGVREVRRAVSLWHYRRWQDRGFP